MKRLRVTPTIVKLFLSCFLFLCFASFAFGENELKLFQYESLPFGKSPEEIFSALNLEKKEPEDPYASDIVGYEALIREFDAGLYTLHQIPAFHGAIVKKYIITFKNDPNIKQLDLYFVVQNDTEKLFIVRKQIPPPIDAKLDIVFASLKKGIDNKLNKPGKTSKTKYSDLQMQVNNTYDPAMVSVWRNSKKSVFLGVKNNLFNSDSPDLIYRDEILWKQYLSGCAKLNQEAKRKEKNASDKSLRNF